MKQKSSEKTMFMSVLMSAPGPLVVGIGLLQGKSSTQLADFVRRSAELLALIVAFVMYKVTSEKANEHKKELERKSNFFVGMMMGLAGVSMLVITCFSNSAEKGNVISGLIIALLGVVANTLFWLKYTKLNKETPNAIVAVQSRLYRAKSLVDGCVVIALCGVMFLPNSMISYSMDKVGSWIVASYLCWCGLKTVKENMKEKTL